ncbi:MAG: chemotaxis protein CheX [Nannocystaceae bacterium]
MLCAQLVTAAVIEGLGESIETLGYDGLEVKGPIESLPEEVVGGYISLAGDTYCVQLGVISSLAGCQRLAAVMLGLEPGDDPLPDSDLGDAIGELSNIFAGTVKTRLHEAGVSVQLGLPMFCAGHVEVSQDDRHQFTAIQIGDVEAIAVVYLHNTTTA